MVPAGPELQARDRTESAGSDDRNSKPMDQWSESSTPEHDSKPQIRVVPSGPEQQAPDQRVVPAGPEQQALDRTGRRRTGTASSRSQWSPPDPDSKPQINILYIYIYIFLNIYTYIYLVVCIDIYLIIFIYFYLFCWFIYLWYMPNRLAEFISERLSGYIRWNAR